MLSQRQKNALNAVRIESEMANVVGASHFHKGQLGAGIGWIVLDQLERLGLIEYLGIGSDRKIRITDAGCRALETSEPATRRRSVRLKMLEPRLKPLEPRLKPQK